MIKYLDLGHEKVPIFQTNSKQSIFANICFLSEKFITFHYVSILKFCFLYKYPKELPFQKQIFFRLCARARAKLNCWKFQKNFFQSARLSDWSLLKKYEYNFLKIPLCLKKMSDIFFIRFFFRGKSIWIISECLVTVGKHVITHVYIVSLVFSVYSR